jgi:hypothetical protein
MMKEKKRPDENDEGRISERCDEGRILERNDEGGIPERNDEGERPEKGRLPTCFIDKLQSNLFLSLFVYIF